MKINNLLSIILILINKNSIISATINPNYYSSDESQRCLMSSFNATISVYPSNHKFKGNTFRNISPETSTGRLSNCSVPHMYWAFSVSNVTQDWVSNLSFGIEFIHNNGIEINVKYVEKSDKSVNCRQKSIQSINNCLSMHISYKLGSISDQYSYECSHNLKKTIKDYVYNQNNIEFRATFEIDLHFIRVDKTNDTKVFKPNKYCLLDWVLNTNSLIIMGSLVLVLIVSIIICCFVCRHSPNIQNNCDSRQLAKLRDKTTNSIKSQNKSSHGIEVKQNNETNDDICGQPIDL